MYECETHMPQHMWRSEDNTQEWVLFFPSMGSKGWTPVARIDDKCLYATSMTLNKGFYIYHVRTRTSLYTAGIHTPPSSSCPLLLYSGVMYTCGDKSSVRSPPLWLTTLFWDRIVTEPEGHNWVNWPMCLEMLLPPPPWRARNIGTWHIISSFLFCFVFWWRFWGYRLGPQAYGSST